MFSEEDILKLRTFCQEICGKPRSFTEQKIVREGIFIWCDDWEIIELCKYLFYGREAYYGDPPPNRLKHNPLWGKDDIALKAEALIVEYKTAEAIIEALRARRNHGGA